MAREQLDTSSEAREEYLRRVANVQMRRSSSQRMRINEMVLMHSKLYILESIESSRMKIARKETTSKAYPPAARKPKRRINKT